MNVNNSLGQGGFGEVYSLQDKNTKKLFAVKLIKPNNQNEEVVREI